ncbi:hypothetical protein CC85DRAFT_247321 [Cutaneotrichosporon oleaginosum]|uniref:Uncharacterized protein n=1 Tax=Cutaneotrichosporon oleaginosum TaxID=879819 RepID=A0A0J0XKN0_9TREE|nr:uncharacterized protein CC85DRAFT_247321 [Cutaneotrichosporon oleaginosum]KLT41650.1 hypothetical protein CC85DRAFT_247321 [Cutaneotrichosporon oleaginosum]TXT08113.1 hypothetical protein COLE_05037 [Cutaneotrichosporon oleaginosum]
MGEREDERALNLAFQTLLDGTREATEQRVELTALRKLCSRGIPSQPAFVRPLAYSLVLGVLPPEKRAWKRTRRAQREKYYVSLHMPELILESRSRGHAGAGCCAIGRSPTAFL